VTITSNAIKDSAAAQTVSNVLVVTDHSPSAQCILKLLAGKGIRAILARSVKIASESLEKDYCNMVFIGCDATAQNREQALKLLKIIKKQNPEMPVVMFATDEPEDRNYGRMITLASQAVRMGCYDFLPSAQSQSIEELIETFVPVRKARTTKAAGPVNSCKIVGSSPKLTHCINVARKVAPTAAPVLVSGESGTGKELICQLIHQASKRANGPFVRLNCAALSESLLESELFGHEKGAFTGADNRRKGRFEMAHGGTLMLDEITETPLRFQAKLLRVLEQQDFERVGGNELVSVNVRVISTTNKNLPEQIRQGRFRSDLYYRLSAVRVEAPPLRTRKEDLNDLVWHFVNIYAPQAQRRITELDPRMMTVFEKYSWPGNIRQLRNVVLTCLILGSGSLLSLADVGWLFEDTHAGEEQKNPERLQVGNGFADEIIKADDNEPQTSPDIGGVRLDELEKQAILETLRKTDGNRTKAADILGITDRTLRDKIKKYRREENLQLI